MGQTGTVHLTAWRWCGRKRGRRWIGRREKYFRVMVKGGEFMLRFRPWLGICAVGFKPSSHSAKKVVRPDHYWSFPSMKKRTNTPGPDGHKHLAAMETSIFEQLLPLVEHCAFRQYDDGSPRLPGWFTVKTSGAGWVVQIKDPDTCTTFSAVGSTLDKALETAALLLACEDAPWEHDTWLAAASKKKPK